jgi:hypothetical protein
MKSYTMADQCKMLMSWETSLDAKALDKIMSVLSLDTYQSRPWSQHVETAWDKAVADCHQQVIEVLGGIFILPVFRLLSACFPPVFRLLPPVFRLFPPVCRLFLTVSVQTRATGCTPSK